MSKKKKTKKKKIECSLTVCVFQASWKGVHPLSGHIVYTCDRCKPLLEHCKFDWMEI